MMNPKYKFHRRCDEPAAERRAEFSRGRQPAVVGVNDTWKPRSGGGNCRELSVAAPRLRHIAPRFPRACAHGYTPLAAPRPIPRRVAPERKSPDPNFAEGRVKRRQRGGFSLLEVVLALAILTAAIAVLGELVRGGLRNAQLARDLSQAQIICESTIFQVEAGLLPPQAQGAPVEGSPGWFYSIEPENTGGFNQTGMYRLRVTVQQNPDQHSRPARFSIVRWMRDPSLVLTQQATQQTILPTTNPSSSSSSTSTGGTGTF